jgi:hypothetical protein
MFHTVLQAIGLVRGGKPSRRKARADRHRNRAVLGLEALEDRLTPASFTVNTLLDTADANIGNGVAQDALGMTSLRAAIQEGNASQDASITINFQQGLNGTIALGTALPTLNRDFGIIGPGAATLTVKRSDAAGTAAFRIFDTSVFSDSVISGLTITNGHVPNSFGGGIRSDGSLTLIELVMFDNEAQWGGAIAQVGLGPLNVVACEIHNNTAASLGGGIFNAGTASIGSGSHIYQNRSDGDGGGVYNEVTGILTINTNTWITLNSAGGSGGGVYNTRTLTMDNVRVWGNHTDAGGRGGGVYSRDQATLRNVTIEENSADKGGGVYVEAGTTTLDNCILRNNVATTLGNGGAYRPGSTLTTINGTIIDDIVQDP